MFLRCANPECASQFDYRQGQLLRAPRQDDLETQGDVKHFWLCGTCANRYFLEYKQGKGVIMLPRLSGRVAPSRNIAA